MKVRVRSRRRAAALASLVVVLVAIGAGSQAFAASGDTYTNVLSPAGAYAGVTAASSALTLTNGATSPDLLTDETITLPAGFGVVTGAPIASNDSSWTATVKAGDGGRETIELTLGAGGRGLAPGDSVWVPLSVSVPCTPPASTDWTTQATYQAPDTTDADAAATLPAAATTVDGATVAYPVAGACGFRFTAISSPQTAGAPISFTVSEVDGAGNPASFYTSTDTSTAAAPVLTGTFGSAGGAPVYQLDSFRDVESGGAEATGSATDFTPGRDQTLTVSLGSITGVSNSFDVGGCAPGATCTVTNPEGNTTVTLTFPTPPGRPTPVTFTPGGAPYTCDGLGTVTPAGSVVAFDASQSADPARPYGFANPIVVTLRYDRSITRGTGVPHFPVCEGDTAQDLAEAADCPKRLTSNAQLPCVTHRDKNGGDLVITVLVAPGDAYWGGP